MKSINRLLKFQFLSYLKSFIIAMAVGISITILANTIFTLSVNPRVYTINKMALAVTFVAIMVSVVFLIVQCFMCFFEDYRFSTRLGLTRKNFFIGNLIFFLIIAIIYSAVFTGIGMNLLKEAANSENIIESTVLSDILDSAESEGENEIPREEIEMTIQTVIKDQYELGFFYFFKLVFITLLGMIGFWMLIGFLVFSLKAKSLIIIIPLLIIWGNVPEFFNMNVLLASGLLFLLSQLAIGFGINYVEESI